jgi:hypothetical protein
MCIATPIHSRGINSSTSIKAMSSSQNNSNSDTKSTSKSPAKGIRNPYQKSPPTRHPPRQKLEKGHFRQKQAEVVYVIRLKQNSRVAFVVRANNLSKASYIQHLVNLIRNDDPSVTHLNILAVIPRRVADGSNNRLMDGNYPMRQFLQVLDDNEDNNSASAETWGRAIAAKITELNKSSIYPTVCSFGGDLTPTRGLPTIDTHLINRDVVTLATHLYSTAIVDGSFFEEIISSRRDNACGGATDADAYADASANGNGNSNANANANTDANANADADADADANADMDANDADDGNTQEDTDGDGEVLPPISADFFSFIDDPKPLFIGNN